MTTEEFKAKRDAMLLRGDLGEMEEYLRSLGHKPSDREVVEMALHKARSACGTLPMELRSESKKWLIDRGYHSLDDGDVPT